MNKIKLFLILIIIASYSSAQKNLTLLSTINYGQVLAGCWHYNDNSGHEYALIGANDGIVIADITNAASPVVLDTIPAPTSIWHELTVLGDYAYAVTEGTGTIGVNAGLLVIDLTSLPGIGKGTAGALQAFAWNKPVIFIETNIRSIFIHFFFKKKKGVKDSEIMPLIEKTVDHKNPREWYYALMDYGAYLKRTENPSRKSLHYTRQSPFKGSNRELRAKILSLLLKKGRQTSYTLSKHLDINIRSIENNLVKMQAEWLISQENNTFFV